MAQGGGAHRLRPAACRLFAKFRYPLNKPVVPSSSSDTIITIQRVDASLRGFVDRDPSSGALSIVNPVAVAIGPYHHGSSSQLDAMEEVKRAALEEFCRVAKQSPDAVRQKIFSVAASARECYGGDVIIDYSDTTVSSYDDNSVDEDDGIINDDDDDHVDGTDNGNAVGEDDVISNVHDDDHVDGTDNGNAVGEDDVISNVHDDDEGDRFAEMLLLDGCFLLQFMVSMCPDDPDAPPEADPLMSRAEVHTCIDAISKDVMLLENQIPWLVLEALMELRPGVPVDRFLALMASAFDVGNDDDDDEAPADRLLLAHPQSQSHSPSPPHLLGLFHRRQVGTARTQSLRVPRLSSFSTTAVELAEMGVKLTASKTKKFGDMSMSKRRRQRLLALFGELSLAPVVLNDLTACWLVNMAAYEACLGATQADNFAVSSYISVVALLVNREEDVQELRGKGIINSAMSDAGTLEFFKWAAPHLRVGHRYYEVFRGLQEYRQERWAWIAIHSFFYRNLKTIIAVLSVIGVLVGLFKTILSLKQPQL